MTKRSTPDDGVTVDPATGGLLFSPDAFARMLARDKLRPTEYSGVYMASDGALQSFLQLPDGRYLQCATPAAAG